MAKKPTANKPEAKKPGPVPRLPIDQWDTIGQLDLAILLGVTPRYITKLENEGVITKQGRGQYNMVSCVKGYLHMLRDENKNRTKTASASALNEAKARLVDAQVEQKTGEIRGELRAEVASMVTELIGGLVADILAIPARVTRDLDLRRKIEEEIEHVQRASAERVERRASGLDDGSDGSEAEAQTIN